MKHIVGVFVILKLKLIHNLEAADYKCDLS